MEYIVLLKFSNRKGNNRGLRGGKEYNHMGIDPKPTRHS